MFRKQNTHTSPKFQNTHRQYVGTNAINTIQKTTKPKPKPKPIVPTEMKSALGFVQKPSISKPIAKGRLVPTPAAPIIIKHVEGTALSKRHPARISVPASKKINLTESIPIRCRGGNVKPKPMNQAGPLLRKRSGVGTTVTTDNMPHHGQRARGFGNYVLSQRRIVRPSSSAIFDYDLSEVEQHNFRHCQCRDPPMKSVPHEELQLLKSGQRATYLEQRYERTPVVKYNYPQATSWRYGWFHRQTQDKIGDTL